MKPEVHQHIGWIKMYLDQMSARNWSDMRDYTERQVRWLEKELETSEEQSNG